MQTPNWREIEETLYQESKEAILQLASEHPDEICCFFAYDVDEPYGSFLLNFDTIANSIKIAKEKEIQAKNLKQELKKGGEIWRKASFYTEQNRITCYNSDVGLFAYGEYRCVRFDDWWQYQFDSRGLPVKDRLPKSEQFEDDYFGGNIRIILWNVIERLVNEDTFQHLEQASPFYAGYQFHESDEVTVLRILNWPNP